METKTPLKAIRAKCLDCCGYDKSEVKNCTATDCPLYLFRKGHKPKRNSVAENSMKESVTHEETEEPD